MARRTGGEKARWMRARPLVLGLAVLALSAIASAGNFDVLAVKWSGEVYRLDSEAGEWTKLQHTNELVGNPNALARDPRTGAIYGCDCTGNYGGHTPPTGSGTLFTLDPDTGEATPVVQLSELPDIRGLAFSNGHLYGIWKRDIGASTPHLPDDLVRISLESGTVEVIGSTGFDDYQGLASAPDGTLYTWTRDYGLLTVDRQTGASTPVAASVDSSLPERFLPQAFEFADDGALYAIDQRVLYVLDPTTGQVLDRIPGAVSDVRGMALIRTSVRVDIRPRRRGNLVNPFSRRAVNVAIMGAEDLDLHQIQTDSLRFGP